MAIRPEDVGMETRVFQITIPSSHINDLKICIGRKYEENGKDRYAVYEVVNAAVKRMVGYYEVTSGEDVIDHEDTEKRGDFHVEKYGPPNFTHDFKDKEKPEKKNKRGDTKFDIIETTKGGDCFYDSVVRALSGNLDEFNEKDVQYLRNELAEFIMGDDVIKTDIIQFYKDQIKPSKNEDGVVSEDIEHFRMDYFDDRIDIEDDKIMEILTKNIKTMKKWVNGVLINAFEKMKNIKVLLLTGTPPVENYHAFQMPTEHIPNVATKFILLDYEPELHFKLIVQKANSAVEDEIKIFRWDQVPEFIQKFFEDFQWYKEFYKGKSKKIPEIKIPEVKLAVLSDIPEVDEAKSESPPFHLSESKLPQAKIEHAVEEVKTELPKASEDEPEDESKSPRAPEAKPELLKAPEDNPELLKAPEDNLEAESKSPRAPGKKTLKIKPVEPKPDELTKEYLSKLTLDQLREMAKEKCPTIAASGKNKDFLITCILNPTNAECSKKPKKGGLNVTRKNK